jgi:ubiquinone/menaquinone biosynthesis C-methylase UbiE
MYATKINSYQSDCPVLLGRMKNFSDYIREFADGLESGMRGLDIASGPGGCAGKYFLHCVLDGCDVEPEVVDSLGSEYNETFTYRLGSENKLPYGDGELDFVVCSCVIQHLGGQEELDRAFAEVGRVLKKGGLLYIMFKSGSHDTLLTHFNSYYGEERTFRVFEGDKLQFGGEVLNSENLLDSNYIPYTKIIYRKI